MPAGAFERDAVAVRSDAAVYDTVCAATINRNHAIDLWAAFAKEILGATQVTQSLLANIADEKDVGVRLEIRMLHCSQYAKHSNEATRIVSDTWREIGITFHTHAYVRPGGEYGVEVCAVNDNSIANATSAPSNDISDPIDSHVAES